MCPRPFAYSLGTVFKIRFLTISISDNLKKKKELKDKDDSVVLRVFQLETGHWIKKKQYVIPWIQPFL